MAVMTLASLVFALAESVPMLFAGRVLQGLAIGGFLGVGSAFVVDHARAGSKALAAALAGVFFRLGFGLGPGIAGITAQYAANPRHLIFEIHIVLMIIGMIAVATASETLMRRHSGKPFRIRIGVPEGQALGFLTFVAPAAFMMSFIEGTLLSVVPIFVVEHAARAQPGGGRRDRLPDPGGRRARAVRGGQPRPAQVGDARRRRLGGAVVPDRRLVAG